MILSGVYWICETETIWVLHYLVFYLLRKRTETKSQPVFDPYIHFGSNDNLKKTVSFHQLLKPLRL